MQQRVSLTRRRLLPTTATVIQAGSYRRILILAAVIAARLLAPGGGSETALTDSTRHAITTRLDMRPTSGPRCRDLDPRQRELATQSRRQELNLAARQRVTAIIDSTFCDPPTSPSLAHGRAPHALRGAGRGVSMHPTTQRRCHTNTARNAGSNQHSASEGDIAASIHDTSSVDSGSVGGSTLDYTGRDDVNGLHKDRGRR